MTERQVQEQKEAKKLKLYTTIFVVVLALLIVASATLAVSKALTKSGVLERNTVAVTIGEHKVTNAELNYFYVDAVLNYYSQVGQYASFFGLDINTPLDKQVVDEETGSTWADQFIDTAISDAKNVYAIVDAANAAGFQLSEDELASIDTELMYAEFNAVYSAGYPSMDSYLKSLYGNAADAEGYRAYLELRSLAGAYYESYADSLTYDDAALREGEKENFNQYSSFTYNYKYIPVNNYLTGGTVNENNVATYSDEEKAAAQKKAQEVANGLVGDDVTSLVLFDKKIANMEGAKENETSDVADAQLYDAVNSVIRDWVTASERKEGDTTVIPSTTTSTVDGVETEVVNGYYAVYFVSSNDNNFPLANVRHILVKPEGGTFNSATQMYDYTAEEMAAAMEKAKELLNGWRANNPTEDSFADLAKENSADGNASAGGLYENVYPGQMVTAFEDWCYDESRQPGDHAIIETDYGYHIMYFSGYSETNYRDYLITQELIAEDMAEWNATITEKNPITDVNLSRVNKDLILYNMYYNY
jgi:parvulin-like peptidyl-prolyl isomerase